MKLGPDRLASLLQKDLPPVWLVAGDEPLIVGEAADAIRTKARSDGYTERDLYVAERGFDWGRLESSGDNLSLFAERRILEIRLPTGKPGKEGAEVIARLAARPPEDTVILIVSAKVDARLRFVAAVEKHGVLVQVWPVDATNLPRWLAQRMRAHGLEPDREAVELLAARVEGNLLAASQEIEKLLLLSGPGPVDADAVRRAVANSARFDVFQLIDAALEGNPRRALHILDGLRGEGEQPPLLIWALARELRLLASIAWQTDHGTPSGTAMSRARVWHKRKPLIASALRRHRVATLHALLMHTARIERMAKGRLTGNAWDEIAATLVALAGDGTAPVEAAVA